VEENLLLFKDIYEFPWEFVY